tara:strand:+ start:1841 stop:2185 length:345 start_codon:yes stop_codon:yes gene_type:complete
MALALNVFQTIAQVVQNVEDEVYTAPVGYTGVVLLAQVTNTGAQSHDITLIHRRDIGGGTEVDTPMLQAYPIPASDTLNMLSGKLVLESGDKLVMFSSDPSEVHTVISILETLN